MTNNRPLILLLGGSGSGKSAVALELEKQYGLVQADSYTTRPPRHEGERGHTFIDYEQFLELMMEHKLVATTEVNGFFYGASKDMVDEADVYVIDPRGASELIRLYDSERTIYYIYLVVPQDVREERMDQRGTAEDIEARKAFDADLTKAAYEVGTLYKNAAYISNVDLQSCVSAVADFIGLEKLDF